MNYYTRFELRFNGAFDTNNPIMALRNSFEEASLAIDSLGNSIQSSHWCKHEEDLRKLSVKFPNGYFILKGDGDDPEDYWVKYFKNGLMRKEKAVVFFPKFDEGLLK